MASWRQCYLGLMMGMTACIITVCGSEGVVEPECYRCFYEKYLDIDAGDPGCRNPAGEGLTQSCPSASCAIRLINTNSHYRVQRYCLEGCREVAVPSEGGVGHVYCCVGHLCNDTTRTRYDAVLLTFAAIISALVVGLRGAL